MTREDRVEHIVDLMTQLRWSRTMCRKLAEEWGVEPVTVRQYSAEASRVIQRETKRPEFREELRAKIREQLEYIASQAVQRVRTFVDKAGEAHEVPDPDYGAAVRALATMSDVWGLKDAGMEADLAIFIETAQRVLPEDAFQTLAQALSIGDSE